MKYVLTENGNIKTKDGKPIVIGDDGKEFIVDAIGNIGKINDLNSEAAGYRKKASANKKILESIPQEIIDNPKAAVEALKTVESLSDEHTLQLETLKTELKGGYEKQLQDKDKEIEDLNNNLLKTNVQNKFATSKTIEKTLLTPGLAANAFMQHFKPDGSAEIDGKVIYSPKKPGELADFEEALEIIINSRPDKDEIWKGTGANGSDSHTSDDGNFDTNTASSVDNIKQGLLDMQK